MIRILLISDSHSKFHFKKIYKQEKPDYAIHAGDSELRQDELVIFDKVVKGNCDFDQKLKDIETLNIEDYNIFITHGHKNGINFSAKNIVVDAKDYGCSIVVHGHTHVVCANVIDNVLVLNPGSITQSRCSFPESYMILTINNNDIKLDLKDAVTYELIENKKIIRGDLC
ncbi:MAG: YfcE family phosphodiesterase [Mycoplasmatales bacterium]